MRDIGEKASSLSVESTELSHVKILESFFSDASKEIGLDHALLEGLRSQDFSVLVNELKEAML